MVRIALYLHRRKDNFQQILTAATLKLKKKNLQKESYHFKTFADEVYFLDNSAKTYRRLDEDVYRRIEEGAWTF